MLCSLTVPLPLGTIVVEEHMGEKYVNRARSVRKKGWWIVNKVTFGTNIIKSNIGVENSVHVRQQHIGTSVSHPRLLTWPDEGQARQPHHEFTHVFAGIRCWFAVESTSVEKWKIKAAVMQSSPRMSGRSSKVQNVCRLLHQICWCEVCPDC